MQQGKGNLGGGGKIFVWRAPLPLPPLSCGPAVDYLFQSIYNQELKLNSLEQYSRSNCVIYTVAKSEANFKQMTDRQVASYVLNGNNHLDLPCEIDDYELDICHPLPSFKKKNPVIIKFVRRSIRNLVYYHKKIFEIY